MSLHMVVSQMSQLLVWQRYIVAPLETVAWAWAEPCQAETIRYGLA